MKIWTNVCPRAVWRNIGPVLIVLCIPAILHAQYLDAGSGSFIFQTLIAGLTLFIFFFSRIREFLKGLMQRRFSRARSE